MNQRKRKHAKAVFSNNCAAHADNAKNEYEILEHAENLPKRFVARQA